MIPALATTGFVRPATWHATANTAAIAAGTATGSVSPAAGTRAGDLLLVIISLLSVSDSIATPSGWTLLHLGTTTVGAGTNRRAYLFRRTADLGSDDTPTWTKTGVVGGWTVAVHTFKLTAGVDVSGVSLATAADTSIVLPSVTPSISRATLFAITSNGGGNNIVTASLPAHWVLKKEITPNPRTSVVERYPWGASPSPTSTLTLNGAGKWVAFVVALQPS